MRGRLPGVSRLAVLPLALLVGVCCLGLGVLGFRVLSATGAFDVGHVEVTGAGGSDKTARATALRVVGGRSLLDVDPGAVAASLAALPTIHSATVDRAFPSTLAIHVTPERPVAIAPVGSSRVVLAASGRVLGEVTNATAGLPLVAAAPSDIPGVGGTVSAPGLRQELRLAAAARHGLRFRQIGYGPDGLTGRTARGLDVRFGDSEDVAAKLKVARSVLRRASTGVLYIDVSVPAAPVMREDAPDPLTADVPVAAAPVVAGDATGDAGGWTAGAAPAESIRTVFG